MKTVFVMMAFALGIQAQVALADAGDGRQLSCQDSDQGIFEIHSIALPNRYEGSYADVRFSCEKQKIAQPGNLNTIWKCTEKRDGEGRMIIEVQKGGFTGGTDAQVYVEQMYPLKPAHVATLYCRK